MSDPEEKTKFFNETAQKLLVFKEEIERNIYIEAIARKYNIAFEDLRKLVNKYGSQIVVGINREEYNRNNREKREKREDGFVQAQKMLLTWLIEDISLFSKIRNIITPNDFKEELYHQVADMLFQQYETDHNVVPAKIINYFESKEEQNEVASLFSTSLQEGMNQLEREKALNEIVRRIKKYSLDYESRHATDIAQLQKIIKEQGELQKLHISL